MDIAAAETSFGLLFVMELGDKTHLAVLSLSGRTRRGPAVFAGATADASDAGTVGARPGGMLLTDAPMPHGKRRCASVSPPARPNRAKEQQAAR